MMTPKIMGALALALAASNVEAGALPTGVCYSPWHHGSVSSDVIQKDFAQVKQYFSGVRTYHAQFAGVNAIQEAAKAGVKISVGIQMGNPADIPKEIDAACQGAKSNPDVVEAIYVGNENLKNGGFGSYTGEQLANYIQKLRTCISNKNIKIGSVQRINEWVGASEAAALAAASDVIGVNIYPFFTPGTKAPIEKLKDQWKEINDKYPGGKVHITETGWPRGGATQVAGNSPSKEIASSFLNDYAQWAKSQPTSYWFMMYDTKGNQPDYENFFGLADTSGVVQLTIPSGDGAVKPVTPAATPAATQAPVNPAPAATQAPVNPTPAATKAPVNPAPAATQAPVNPAPAATTGAPAATKPSGTPAPATTTGAPAATKPAGGPVTPFPGKQTDVTSTKAPVVTPVVTPVAPVATPAATATNGKGKGKKDCHA